MTTKHPNNVFLLTVRLLRTICANFIRSRAGSGREINRRFTAEIPQGKSGIFSVLKLRIICANFIRSRAGSGREINRRFTAEIPQGKSGIFSVLKLRIICANFIRSRAGSGREINRRFTAEIPQRESGIFSVLKLRVFCAKLSAAAQLWAANRRWKTPWLSVQNLWIFCAKPSTESAQFTHRILLDICHHFLLLESGSPGHRVADFPQIFRRKIFRRFPSKSVSGNCRRKIFRDFASADFPRFSAETPQNVTLLCTLLRKNLRRFLLLEGNKICARLPPKSWSGK